MVLKSTILTVIFPRSYVQLMCTDPNLIHKPVLPRLIARATLESLSQHP